MNILYIMFDQLRFDYLSCAGHPYLETPHIDGLAQRGVRFTRAYVQSPTCGSSRMSSYTGRYPSSHGVQFNGYPLRVGEWTMGDHLRKAGMSCHLIGKTHMVADAEGMQRLGLAPDSIIGVRQTECGFDPFVRDDGLWAEGPDGFYDSKRSPYNEYLKSKGYPGENPWSDFANAGAEGQDVASGWFMVNADKPANIAEEDSETPWLTREAMRFIEAAEQDGDQPWCAHLSYIKPHWPYIVPAPYHDMYGAEHVLPAVRSAAEREEAHPVFEGMMNNQIGQAFSRDEVREKVIPAYMGLIKQADDQMGHLFAWLEATGRMQDTMIVLTSDHGDYLGDHWLGEKNLFHEPSIKVPLIIYDPRSEADATRGTTCDELVEAIDLLPTFLEAAGGTPAPHILEGRSLMPWLRGEMPEWRDYAVAEFDYATLPLCEKLGLAPKDARLFMVVDKRWKFMHAEGGLRPMLFDLQDDPDELIDLAKAGAHQEVIDLMYDRLLEWGLRMSQRITLSDEQIATRRGKSARKGILLGVYEASEVDDTLTEAYRRPIPKPAN
ncbi:sulfatase-like hydrolase/transferase [Phaeobacter piscinae]|uniref:sulfatase-like hydrolase/transferase n=1 Tax=Phaeobacter piscinae TaxID=1580596 RepID=UPI00058E98D9|nr:sulfatase-like hydrolase/transferase [Phaeobacter piscinae]UTS79307.1 Multifunctional alkaline phosphatase superfamily protein [Phaeobacter piscinae]